MKENGQTNLRETEAKEIKKKKRMMKDELELLVSLP